MASALSIVVKCSGFSLFLIYTHDSILFLKVGIFSI